MSYAITTRFGKTYWRTRPLRESEVREAFLNLRKELEARGVEFDSAVEELKDTSALKGIEAEARAEAWDSSSGSDEPTDDEPTDDELTDGEPTDGEPTDGERTDAENWALVDGLNWALRSDREIKQADIVRSLRRYARGDRARLRAWMAAQAAMLAADPYIGTKGQKLRLQFVALGEKWVSTLRASPELADYLETEAQPVDLAAYM